MLGIILAGGNGTRFSEKGCCKPLLRVNGKYLIEYALDNLVSMHVSKALIVVGKYKNEIFSALGGNYRGVSLDYVLQEFPAGCIHALFCALARWNGETVVLQLGDELHIGFKPEVAALPEGVDFACGYTSVENKESVKENYSIRCSGKAGRLISCEEKPKTVHNRMKGTGFCIFSPACIMLLKERYVSAPDHFVTLCDYMNHLIENGKTGIVIPTADAEININTPEKLQYAERILYNA